VSAVEIQISSGFGPAECEIAVSRLLAALTEEFPDIRVLERQPGRVPDSLRSVRVASDSDLSFLEGTVKWAAQSPLRPSCRRKNWFVDVSVCAEAGEQKPAQEGDIRYETFLSPRRGGQRRDKTRTGVRAVHVPTGLSVTAVGSRSQRANKAEAANRLLGLLAERQRQGIEDARALDRLEHARIELGNPVRVYEGPAFRRVL